MQSQQRALTGTRQVAQPRAPVAMRPLTRGERLRAERGHLTEETYNHLVTAIAERRFLPGQPLQQQQIARELGVSRTPVREALQLLARDGLAAATDTGFAVAQLTVKDVRDT